MRYWSERLPPQREESEAFTPTQVYFPTEREVEPEVEVKEVAGCGEGEEERTLPATPIPEDADQSKEVTHQIGAEQESSPVDECVYAYLYTSSPLPLPSSPPPPVYDQQEEVWVCETLARDEDLNQDMWTTLSEDESCASDGEQDYEQELDYNYQPANLFFEEEDQRQTEDEDLSEFEVRVLAELVGAESEEEKRWLIGTQLTPKLQVLLGL